MTAIDADPRDALLSQAREALGWAEWGDDDHCPVCGHAVEKHAETCELSLAIAAIDAFYLKEKKV